MRNIKYKKLAMIIDKIFKKYQNDNIISSISYLNFVKGHDQYYFLFPELFKSNKYHFELMRNYSFIEKVINYLKEFRNFKIKNVKIPNKRYELVFLNNFTNELVLKKRGYDYYSDFDLLLKNKKIDFLSLYKNFSGKILKKSNSKNNRIILNNLNNFLYEFLMIFKILKKKFLLNLSILFGTIQLNKDELYFFKKAIKLKNITSSAYSIRLCNQVESYLIKLKPKYFVLTIEGNSWEKILIKHIKLKFKDIKIIGVQFSVIFTNDYPLKKNIGNIFEPHILICKKYINYLTIKKLNLFRSSKIIYNNLKLDDKKKIIIKKKFNKISCLVTPDKSIPEILSLIDLINELIKQKASINFYLRLHPNLNKYEIKKIRDKCHGKVIFSQKTLKQDLRRCNILIYKGSSICFDALDEGLFPIYYNNSQFNIDPIKNLEIKRNYFSNDKELLNIITDLKKIKKLNSKTKLYLNRENQQIF